MKVLQTFIAPKEAFRDKILDTGGMDPLPTQHYVMHVYNDRGRVVEHRWYEEDSLTVCIEFAYTWDFADLYQRTENGEYKRAKLEMIGK